MINNTNSKLLVNLTLESNILDPMPFVGFNSFEESPISRGMMSPELEIVN